MNDQHFNAVIVGSGFGGSVMAYRLAEAGLSVCLLERGKPYPPTSFPRSPYKMKNNFWDPSAGLHGMFNIWSFSGLGSVISSGLGGGSLIYANVLIRKDEKWFVHEDLKHGGYEDWPVTRADLDPHYDRVEKMLGAQRYPFSDPPYDRTPKTVAFKAAAEQLELDWHLPNLAVTFANPGERPVPGEPIKEAFGNLHGRTRYTCRLCGECDIGCNFGSKNTLDYNYLSAAQMLHGADIRTCCEVRAFEPPRRVGEAYTIHYVQHDPDPAREGQPVDTDALPLHMVTADRLILSAGTFGTTFLLLKNRSVLPHISRRLGTRFCGNGDLLTFAVRCADMATGKRVPRIIDGATGPVITSTIRLPGREDGGEGRGFYIQDAGYPQFVNWMLQLADTPSALWEWRRQLVQLVDKWLSGRPETDIGAEVSQAFGSCELSAGLLPLLGMGRDIPNGHLKLRDGKLDCDWAIRESKPYFNRVRQTMHAIAGAMGAGLFLDNPIWYLNQVITVHPLGGCPMGRSDQEGVVDAYGQVFNYPGLYIADGSVMPGPVGANPSLTIAALADRFADNIINTK